MQAMNRLSESSKLLKIDGQRFDLPVERTMMNAISWGNPFTVAYRGFEIGDPEVDKRIVVWADLVLVDDKAESAVYSIKGRWARRWWRNTAP
jgi:hypothetical protein